MRFNSHSDLAGTHARFGASNYHWINWSDDKFDYAVDNMDAMRRGTRLHELARLSINDGIRFSTDPEHMTEPYQATLALYVNDAIDLGMRAEQTLVYTSNFYGTADTIRYGAEEDYDKPVLRIHDYKSGITKASMWQLYVYAVYFCLEYEVSPFGIYIFLRIYQNGEIQCCEADPDIVFTIMETAIAFNKRAIEREQVRERQ